MHQNVFSPYYNKRNGVHLGFLLGVLLHSRKENLEKTITYLFYISNIISYEVIKKTIIDKEFLLRLIFELTENKKLVKKATLRHMVGIKDKGTFDKYFKDHIISLGLKTAREYTLLDIFKILKFWQGDDKWGRMEAFGKGELARLFTNGSYDNLEILMTDGIRERSYNISHDYITPAEAKKLVGKILDNKSKKTFYDNEFSLDYLNFFFIIFLVIKFKNSI